MNKVFLSGNLTRDPEVRYTQAGKAYARMGIAVNRPFSKDKVVDFFTIVAWDKTAEFCGHYLTKGNRILVEGRMQTYSYDAQDGTKRSGVDVIAENIEFASSKRSEGGDDNYSSGRPASSNRDSDSYGRRESTSQRRSNDYEFGGEPVDPDDTPF